MLDVSGLRGSTLIFAPFGNSYKRFVKNAHAPTSAQWGYENRTTAIRIPGGDFASKRIEHRVAGGDTNPYLAMAVVLGSALLGIENKLKPQDQYRIMDIAIGLKSWLKVGRKQ